MRFIILAGAMMAAAAAWMSGASAQSGAPTAAPAVAAARDPGEVVWTERCSACHDNPTERIPPRAIVASKTMQAVIYALTKGPMQPQATGLTAQQINDVAAFVTRRPGSVALDASVDVHANMCKRPAAAMHLGPGDWNGWGVDSGNSRFNRNPGISAADVPRLKLKWAFAYPASQGLQPTLAGGRLFVSSRSGHLFSLDPATGCTYWVVDLPAMPRGGISVQPLPKGGKAHFAAYFSIENNHIMALNAETGEQLWSTQIEGYPLQHVTGSAVFYNGRIYQGVASQEEVAIRDPKYPCCTISGKVIAVDAQSGKILWQSNTIPEEPKEIGASPAGTKMYGPAGAGVWATPAIDPRRNAVYVATGNSNTPISTQSADAVLAFDLDTGRMLWRTQVVADDNVCAFKSGWTGPGTCNTREYDLTGGVILQDLGNGHRVILASSKSGEVYAFDPNAGGKILWRKQVHSASGYGGNWGLAIDSAHVYVNTPNVVPRPGSNAVAGGIAALDIATGEQAWYTKAPPAKCSWSTEETLKRAADCTASQQAGLALIPGILFAGSIDGHDRAYDAHTGQIVWDFDTGRPFPSVNGATAHGGSLSYGTHAVGYGMLFVDSGAPGHHEGNALLAFSVDGK